MALILVAALGAAAQDKLAVSVEPHWTKWKSNCMDWGLNNYGIKLKSYLTTELVGGETTLTSKGTVVEQRHSSGNTPGARAAEFDSDLANAQLLSFGIGVSDRFYLIPEHRKAIDAFLEKGGTIIYHYNSGPANIPSLNGLGKMPGLLPSTAMLQGEVSATAKSSLLREPKDLSKMSAWGLEAAGAWPKWSDKQQTLIHKKGDPDAGLLLLFEGVRGKGGVIINRLDGVGKGSTAQVDAVKALIGNIMRHVWGSLEKGAMLTAASAPAPAASATTVPVSGLNPLYFNGLNKAAWWNKDWSSRLPLIVREPLGVDRVNLTVSAPCQLPATTDASSIRVVSSGGRELPSQARTLPDGRFEVVFADDFDANATNGYFIYCDANTKPKPNYKEQVTLWKSDGLFTLQNRLTEATLSAARPAVYAIQAAGCSTGNQLMRGDSFERLGAGFVVGVGPNATSARVLDDGPLRKTIEYSLKGKDGALKGTANLSLDAGSRLLHCECSFPTYISSRWCPGKGLDPAPDAFVWPSKSGVRKIEFTYESSLDNKPTELSEGWYAFTDGATGQAVGELFDLQQTPAVTWLVVGGSWGCMASSGAKPGRRALVALPDGYGVERLRQEYLAFKNPPQVALAAVQTQKDCPATPAAPVWNKNFITYFHIGLMPGRNPFTVPWQNNYGAYWDETMPKLKERGFNGVGLFPYFWDAYEPTDKSSPSFTAALQEKAGAQGMASYLLPPAASGNFGDPFYQLAKAGIIQDKREKDGGFRLNVDKVRAAMATAAAKVAANRPTSLFLLDETCYPIQPDDAAAFRETYAMEPVAKIDMAKLAEPAQHNTALFQINAYTEVLRGMADAAHKANPGNRRPRPSQPVLDDRRGRRRPPRFRGAVRLPRLHLHGSLWQAQPPLQILRQIHAGDVQQPEDGEPNCRLHRHPGADLRQRRLPGDVGS